MGIGASLALIAIGAILVFALELPLREVDFIGIDIETVGWILMIAGAVGLVVTLVLFAPRPDRSVVTRRPEARRPLAADEPYEPAPPPDDPPPPPPRGRGQGYGPPAGPPAYAGPSRGPYSGPPNEELVEYFAGVDADGRERWVVGRVERRERRADGEWMYLRPAQPGHPHPDPRWVSAEQTRVLPPYRGGPPHA
ncbi:MAG TPA: hypothetical protein VIL34_10655 [Actinopolymorphaceae bacterium]|jgi:hypothetical protein